MRSEVIFVGHGSPMNVIADNEWTRNWKNLKNKISKPKGIIAISAHWYINHTAYNNQETFEQIYDMYGFPQEIYDVKYNAHNDLELTAKIKNILQDDITVDNEWGLDHGLWSALKFMYPEADIPMSIISIDFSKNPIEHFEIARKLRSLREEGYLVICSGNIVHNLRTMYLSKPSLVDEAIEFDDLVEDKILSGKFDDLVNYKTLPNWQIAAPTPDHYLPLVYALGFLYGDEDIEVFNKGGEYGAVTMTSYIFK
ncbi:MAG: 4,5-DOPA dioxygenase extradiol [Finegoldia magna]|nr:4,5-DOPA dioxygenase extradiol [Finegoldia magna]